MNRLSAFSRCAKPGSICRHSAAAMIRGTTSNGQARSIPWPSSYTVKVMPMARTSRSASSWRRHQPDAAEFRELLHQRLGRRPGGMLFSSTSSFQALELVAR